MSDDFNKYRDYRQPDAITYLLNFFKKELGDESFNAHLPFIFQSILKQDLGVSEPTKCKYLESLVRFLKRDPDSQSFLQMITAVLQITNVSEQHLNGLLEGLFEYDQRPYYSRMKAPNSDWQNVHQITQTAALTVRQHPQSVGVYYDYSLISEAIRHLHVYDQEPQLELPAFKNFLVASLKSAFETTLTKDICLPEIPNFLMLNELVFEKLKYIYDAKALQLNAADFLPTHEDVFELLSMIELGNKHDLFSYYSVESPLRKLLVFLKNIRPADRAIIFQNQSQLDDLKSRVTIVIDQLKSIELSEYLPAIQADLKRILREVKSS